MPDVKKSNNCLNDVWRTCRKIQTAIFKYGLKLLEKFIPLDPANTTFVSESKFVTILTQLKNTIGLSDTEISEVTDYFKQPDGRVAYMQFCRVVCEEDGDHSRNRNLINGLEWEDPLHVNPLSKTENRRLCILLTKIAQTVRLRDIVLMPFFQDYELIAKNEGSITLSHFSRVLHFMGILLSEDDFLLLVKRYMKNSYLVNYVAFVKNIEEIVRYCDEHRLVDYSEDFIENFPGRLIDVKIPKLPRPEIGKINISDVFGGETSFHPVLKPKPLCCRDYNELIVRIKKHIYDNAIRVHDFFEGYDHFHCGFVTKNQFLRVLDAIGVSGLDRMYLTEDELILIVQRYADINDGNRVNWRAFETDMDSVFTEEYQTTMRAENRESPSSCRLNQQKKSEENRNLCEEALDICRARISKRHLYLRQYFKMFDRLNHGHVSRTQARQVIYSNGILLSIEEFDALERRYNDDLGFNFVKFLEEVDPQDYALPKYEVAKECREPTKQAPTPKLEELDIVLVLAKVKKQAVLKRIRIVDFLKDYDKLNQHFIYDVNFRRGLDNANIKLTQAELDLICTVFKSPLRGFCIDYKRFCDVIEEVFTQPCLERAPKIIPLQHLPSRDTATNFLNFDERTIVSKALQKLAKHSDNISNLSCVFDDYDCSKCGTVSQNNFLRALTVRELTNLLSSREIELICKCFGQERGLRREVNYKKFLCNLDVLAATRVKLPF